MICTPKWLLLALVVLTAAAIVPSLADTWDIASQFTTAANPNGQWSYGFDNTTTDPPEPYVGYNFTIYDTALNNGGFYTWNTSFDFSDAGVYQPSKPQVYKNTNGSNGYEGTPPGKVVAKPYWRPLNWNGTGEVKEKASIIRWTCPTTGDYTFFGSFKNTRGNDPGGYAIVKNTSTVLMYNRALGGFAPNNIAPIGLILSLTAGDTIDIIGRYPYFGYSVNFTNPQVVVDTTIKSGDWAVSGYVRNSGGAGISGTTVKNTGGTESVTAGTDGSYFMPILNAGSFTIQASKPGFEPATQNVTIDGASAQTKDFTLSDGVDIAGTVTDHSIVSHPAMSGVSVATADGVYSATTNSLGAYTLRVTRGSYNVNFYKLNYVPQTKSANASSGGVTLDAALDPGWDFASDFTNAGNPTGPWNLGYATGSAYSQSPDSWTRMPNVGHWSALPTDQAWWGIGDPGFNGPSFWKQTLLTPTEQDLAYYGLRCYRESKKVVMNPSGKADRWAAARFIAPSDGYYNVTIRFAASSPWVVYPGPNFYNGTNLKVGALYYNSTSSASSYLMPISDLQGFIGRAVNGYTDSQSTGTPLLTYTTTMDLKHNDKIDALVYNPVAYPDYGGYSWNGPGWAQLDMTVTLDTTAFSGRVVSSRPGNPGIGGATVTASGTSTYSTTADSAGYYTLSVKGGASYTVSASASGYGTVSRSATILSGDTQTQNFTLTVTGPWDAATDFSPTNPSGEWTYGFVDGTDYPPTALSGYAFTPYDTYTSDANSQVWKTSMDFNDAGVLNPDKPSVYKQLTGAQAGQLAARPYERPLNWNGTGEVPEKPSIVRWTAPSSGYFTFKGTFTNTSGAHIVGYAIIKNSTTELIPTNFALSGYAPNNVRQFNLVQNLNAGDKIDFVARDPVFSYSVDWRNMNLWIDSKVKSGQWLVTGTVRDAGSNPVAGAVVANTGGYESVTTGTDGTYALALFNGGTVSLQAGKAGYEPDTESVTVSGSTAVTRDFVLANGADISGKVYDTGTPGNPGIAGALVATSNGIYSTTTDSAGNYSIRVTRGVYSVKYTKVGFFPKTVTADASAGSITLNVGLDQGYDFASDFSNSNPSGPWSFGYASGSDYAQSPVDMWTAMSIASGQWFTIPSDICWTAQGGAAGFNAQSFFKNTQSVPLDAWTGYYGFEAYREPGKVIAHPSGYPNKWTSARFIAPSGGYYHVDVRFAGQTPYMSTGPGYLNGTNAKVGVMRNNGYVLPLTQLSGFAGRSAVGYTDSQSTGTPVVTYSDALDLAIGDKIDALVMNNVAYPDSGGYSWYGPGWTQVDVTVTKDATALVGRVTSALPGNPGIPGAKIILNGWNTGATYDALTDVNGYYVMSVRPDTYDIEARASGYNSSPAGLSVAVAASATTTQNFQLTHSGTWSLTSDFSTVANPFGQWSFGYYDDTVNGQAVTPGWAFSLFNGTAPFYGMRGWSGVCPTNPGWPCFLVKNGTGSPLSISTDGTNTTGYIEPNHLSFGGGDDYHDAPAIRWTSPDSRAVDIALTIASQIPASTGYPGGGTATVTLFKNGAAMATKTVQGFVGRAVNGFTDSVGPGPVATFDTVLAVNPGDTLDLVLGTVGDIYVHHWAQFGWPMRGLDVWETIGNATGVQTATTIAGIQAMAQGTTVILTAPVQLGCATVGALGFDKRYGNSTPGSDYCFYVQSPDRVNGIKCLHDGTVPTYDPTYSITFTGTIDVQQGQKVVKITSINSAVAGTGAKPLGKGSKALKNNNTLVKVWGKVTQLVANTGADNDKWTYEYIVINDGGQDIKIPMHEQANWMVTSDATIGGLAVGHMIAVTGISGTTTGTDAVVYPRSVFDIVDYTASGRM